MNHHDYWKECLATAAEEDDPPFTLTESQLNTLATAAMYGHENYGMAFYSPPPSDRISAIEDEWRRKLLDLQREFDSYRENAETAVKQALNVDRDGNVSIHGCGEVLLHGGRTVRLQ